MRLASKCGFGQTSSNCFVDIVRQFAGPVAGQGGK
jgi:hypothetical protein